MSKKIPINYKFECLNHQEYNMVQNFKVSSGMFDFIMKKSKDAFKKKKGVDVENIKTPNKFNVHPKFLKFVENKLFKDFKEAKNQIMQDGIKILNKNVNNCYFEKINSEWKIYINYIGEYADMRD